MTLVYRGISYTPVTQETKVTPVSYSATYRGIPYTPQRTMQATPPANVPLMYRGIPYAGHTATPHSTGDRRTSLTPNAA